MVILTNYEWLNECKNCGDVTESNKAKHQCKKCFSWEVINIKQEELEDEKIND